MTVLLRTLFERLLSVLYPPFCIYCRTALESDSIVCTVCDDLIKPIVSLSVPINNSFMTIVAVSNYQEPLKRLILSKNWSVPLASTHIARLIYARTPFRIMPCDYLIPIPLHWTRKMTRGFNQSELIAQELAQLSGRSVLPVLKRVKKTAFQASLTLEARALNVGFAFAVDEKYADSITGKHIVLVDDLCTTGATLRAAAKLLMRYKPASINAVVGARVIEK